MARGEVTSHIDDPRDISGRLSATVFSSVLLMTTVMLGIACASSVSASERASDGANIRSISTPDEAADKSNRDTIGQKRCEFFVTQKILSARDPEVLDHWEKDGKRVFEIRYLSTGVSDRVSRLCVYDLETRAALLPAVADQDAWRP